jgi:hypothetical protein
MPLSYRVEPSFGNARESVYAREHREAIAVAL